MYNYGVPSNWNILKCVCVTVCIFYQILNHSTKKFVNQENSIQTTEEVRKIVCSLDRSW